MARVSVPEKTLEHWLSQYVTYRYRSKAALWWPARGEDIDVRWLPGRPGKSVQLEVKTTKVRVRHRHDVLINLGQLWDYTRRPHGLQPFYVFPWPDWSGELATAARRAGLWVTELAFQRSGPWWFGEWMVVMTTEEVAGVLKDQLAAHGSSRRKNADATLVSFDVSGTSPRVTWGSATVVGVPTAWVEFWGVLEACGRPWWPQTFVIPEAYADSDRLDYRDSRQLLYTVADSVGAAEFREGERHRLYVSEGDGGFRLWEPRAYAGSEREVLSQDIDDHRQVVFLDAGVLRSGEAGEWRQGDDWAVS